MEALGMVELTTPRCVLRKFRIEDAQDVFEGWAGSAAACRTISWGPHKHMEETREMVQGFVDMADHPYIYNWAVEHAGRVVGNVVLYAIDPINRSATIGYNVAVAVWNCGFATEAAAAVLRFGFEMLGLHRISATHDVSNPASARVLQKLGMQSEGILRGAARREDGSFEDRVQYARLSTDGP